LQESSVGSVDMIMVQFEESQFQISMIQISICFS